MKPEFKFLFIAAFTILIYTFNNTVLSQSYFKHLDSSITKPLEKGIECLKEKQPDCLNFLDSAIEIAKKGKDSTLAMTQKEVSRSLYNFANLEIFKTYTLRALNSLNHESHPGVTSNFYKYMAFAYTRTQEFDSAYISFDEAIKYSKKARDFDRVTDFHVLKADTYNRQGKTKRALETLNFAKPFAEQCENPMPKIGLTFVMGNVYLNNEDYELAAENFEKAAHLFKEVDPYMYNLSIINFCKANNDLDNPEHSIQLLPDVIKALDEDYNAQYASYNLGQAYLLVEDYNRSLELAKNNIEIAKARNDLALLSLNYKLLTRNYINMGNGKEAVSAATKAIAYENQKEEFDYLVVEAYRLQAKSYRTNNQIQKSLEALEIYTKLNDSLHHINDKKEILNLQEYYEAEQKKDKIRFQEEEIKALNVQAENDKLTKTLYGIGMFSFIAIAGLLYFVFKQRIKKNKIEREKQEEIYKQEIAFKKKELASQTLHLVQKSTFIQELKENLEKIKKSPELFKIEFRRLVMLLKKESAEDKDWEIFKSYFSEVHNNFDIKIKAISADITQKEIRLASFLKMNLTTKEIASMLNVLPDSVIKSKYRLKKKLGLNKETDLTEYLSSL